MLVSSDGPAPIASADVRIAMLYSWDPTKELADYHMGLVPSHRLFGAVALAARGVRVHHCRWRLVPLSARDRRLWKIWQAAWVLFTQWRYGVVICATEASALPVLLLRRLGLLRRPVIVFSVAVLTDAYLGRGRAARLKRALIRSADAVTAYATSQLPLLERGVGIAPRKLHFMPFGVDVDFFTPRELEPEREVLAAGSNAGKDFATLTGALPRDWRCLIVTDSVNAAQLEHIQPPAGVRIEQAVPIAELRDLYASSRCTVIPLRDVPYSSGQTVLLENLAMGRPVIVSDVAMIRDYVTPTVATLVPCGDTDALRAALLHAPTGPVPEAVTFVCQRFSSAQLAERLVRLCQTVSSRA